VIGALVRQARPRQWVKNVLVFAAPGAAGVLDDASALWPTLIAFVAFCLVSSGTYYWNDLLDIDADRLHPTKRHRPLASGAIPLGVARIVGTSLIVGGTLLGFATGHWETVAVLAVYAVLTLSYSVHLKHLAVVDLIAIASGFVLRAMAGAAAADVPMSSWFVLCTTFGSLFIVTGKRYAELRELGEEAAATRATLEAYSLTYLRSVLSVSLGATIVAYCIWAFETAERSGSDFPFYELSIVPMLTALLRYQLILEQGHGGAPEEVFAADRSLQAFGVIWLITFALGVYVG
jgi:decaprenyl-phosphate phosphoribosyltransferase